jgi:3-methyladenine DNA glycosylase AlkD
MAQDIDARTQDALTWLKRRGTKRNRDGLARYGIVAPKAFGVSMRDVQALAKRLGPDHALALKLWDTGWYEAQLLTAFVAEPTRLTSAQMDRWAREMNNWAVCDTLCFKLFDRSLHAFRKVTQWKTRKEEFVKRSAFALLASLALHDKTSGDAEFLRLLPAIERAATDERNFVKKGVSWALRSIGRRNAALHAAAIDTSTRLAESPGAAARWIGRDALREFKRRPPKTS